ncbi:hypothetical protein AB4Z32_12705 [Massilia sp. 2TAF26]|uniref:hypothetical protein n=1 Tax=Massilia sp. 2TAF26 TaxID=3233012 RepID=UPI003F9AF6EE
MKTFHFPNNAGFVGNRPFADVVLNPSSSSTPTHKCLVDTGADYLQLPLLAATASGLSLVGATNFPISTASGAVSMLLKLSAVPVDIEGYLVSVDVLFDPTNTALPLAGRNVLLAAFDLGFETATWHWS